MSRIPRRDVRVSPIRPGHAIIRHRSGLELGEVLLWDDGVWVAYAGPVDPKGCDEKTGDAGTRAEAVDLILNADAHSPNELELRSGTTMGLRLRDATEEESRREMPAAWAWWDKVRPLCTEDDDAL